MLQADVTGIFVFTLIHNYTLLLPHQILFSLDFPLIIKHFIDFQVGVFFGGLAIAKDEQVIKSNCPNIIVGTPGRILALVRSKKLNLKNLKHFILDECDKMLEQLGILIFSLHNFTNLMFKQDSN